MNTEVNKSDEFWINKCIALADTAILRNEVPVAAIVVHNNQIVGQAFNRKELDQNPIAHAEILALQEAARNLNRWRLSECTLYVTLEPCIMCTGAIVQSRVKRLVYATKDPKAGAVDSVYKVFQDNFLNHKPEVCSGVEEEKAKVQLKGFFSDVREKKTRAKESMRAPEASM